MKDLVQVGSIRKVHGLKGEVKLIVEEIYEDDVEEASFFFIGANQERALPYEVEQIRGSDWIVKFTEHNSKEESAALTGKLLFLRANDVSAKPEVPSEPTEKYDRLVGFSIMDDELGEVGSIEETIVYPQQIMGSVMRKDSDNEEPVLVPLNTNFIKGIDFTTKVVYMTLPAGILDL